jgi:hypothetical protein
LLALIGNEQFGVTDDVDEQDVRDLQLDFFLDFQWASGEPINLGEVYNRTQVRRLGQTSIVVPATRGKTLRRHPARHTKADRMAAHRRLDQRRDDLCEGGLRKGAVYAPISSRH